MASEPFLRVRTYVAPGSCYVKKESLMDRHQERGVKRTASYISDESVPT
jgi:hypothetical protein